MTDKTTTLLATLLIVIAVGTFVVGPHLNSDTQEETQRVTLTIPINTEIESSEVIEEVSSPTELPVFTKESLAQYDGTDTSLPIYVAFEGSVYDVTEGKRFYAPGGAYHFLAGTDGTPMLRIAGGGIIKEKYPIVGTYVE
jgi:predicted heme/steroid binding protein